jgi:hypothetical protein
MRDVIVFLESYFNSVEDDIKIVLRRNGSPVQNIVCGLLWNNHSSSRYSMYIIGFIKTKNLARDCLPRLEMM